MISSIRGPVRLTPACTAFSVLLSMILSPLVKADPTPLVPPITGLEWRYTARAVPVDDPHGDPEKGHYEILITEVKQTDALTTLQLREYDTFSRRYRYSQWEISEEKFTIRNVLFPGPLGDGAKHYIFDFFHLPLLPKTKVDSGPWLTEVKGLEKVRVPDLNEPRMAWRLWVVGTHEESYTVVGDYWFLPGYGIVKSRLNAFGWYIDTDIEERVLPNVKVKP